MRSLVLVALGLVVVVVAGCAPVVERARSTPVAAPPFASEEEALAAATEAYARYVDVVEDIGHDGGSEAGRIREVTTGAFLEIELESFDRIQRAGQSMRGTITFRDIEMQQISPGPANVLTVYLCEDVSDVTLVDSEGRSLTTLERPDTNYFVVSFDRGTDGQIRISSRVRWDDRAC